MTVANDVVLDAADVDRFARDVLSALGMPGADAALVAESMVWSAAHGRVTHSLIRLDLIARRARGGGLALSADWTPVRRRGNATLLDAGNAWGVLAGAHGMRHAIEAASTHGAGVTLIRNCDNTGPLSWYTSRPLAERMIGIAITNGAPLMPPWGGAAKLMGNQAFSIASPAGRHPPVVLDMALGAENLGVLRAAAAAGTPLAPGLAVTATGAPTSDAREWRDGGAVLPIGGHRGYGLALMWELLTGVLSGGQLLDDIGPMDDLARPTGNSLFLVAIDPAAFLSYDDFVSRVDLLVDRIHESPTVPGVARVHVPGEDRAALAATRMRTGIPFPADHVATLTGLAAELSVSWPGEEQVA